MLADLQIKDIPTSETALHGQALADMVRLDSAPCLIARSVGDTEIAATELRSDNPKPAMTKALPSQDGYLVGLQLRDYPSFTYWENGRRMTPSALRAGDTLICDLKRSPAHLVDKPFHSIQFFLSRGALDALADESNSRRIEELNYQPGIGVADHVITNLGLSLLPAFANPDQVNRTFLDHAVSAVATHVAETYGGMSWQTQLVRGGLSPWQERRAKEVLGANLDGNIGSKELARECGLSISHFSRAFRNSTGLAPHTWLLRRRIDEAKALLADAASISLSHIALACGFADQSHFTRVFTRMVGVSPGAWRRCLQS